MLMRMCFDEVLPELAMLSLHDLHKRCSCTVVMVSYPIQITTRDDF